MNPIDLKKLRAQLSEYDPEQPRCQKRIYRPTAGYFDYGGGGYYDKCCRPENHDGPCQNTRPPLGWPGYSTLVALIDAAESATTTKAEESE